MSDFEGDFIPPYHEWDLRPEDVEFNLDPEFLGTVPLNDDGSVFANVYADHTGDWHQLEDFNFTALEDLLGIPNDNPGYEVGDFSDYVPGIDDDMRQFPNREAMEAWLEDTGFWDSCEIWYDEDNDVWYVELDPSP